MSNNPYSHEFKEKAEEYEASYKASVLPSYEEVTGVNSEALKVVEFPEPDISFQLQELHTISLKSIPLETSNSGVTSHQESLSKDPGLLHKFFLHHNTPPQLLVNIQGYHYKWTTRRYKAYENREIKWKMGQEREKATGFKMSYNESPYVLPSEILHLTNPEVHDHSEDCSIDGIIRLFVK